MLYHIAIDGQQRGPFPMEQLLSHGLTPQTLVWTEGMPQWLPASQVPELASLFATPNPRAAAPINYASLPPVASGVGSTKIVAGIFGIVLGALGIHKFIYGATGAGLVMLLVSVLGIPCGCFTGGIGFSGWAVMHLIGFIEGIIYLTKTDEQFYYEYIVGKKAWF